MFQTKYSIKIYNYNYLMPTAIVLIFLHTKLLSIRVHSGIEYQYGMPSTKLS